jgi:multidrug efflux system outer membrane protein
VVELALANNRDLRVAALNIERARAQYGIARAGLFPTWTAGAGGSRSRTPGSLSSSGEPRIATQYSADLG